MPVGYVLGIMLPAMVVFGIEQVPTPTKPPAPTQIKVAAADQKKVNDAGSEQKPPAPPKSTLLMPAPTDPYGDQIYDAGPSVDVLTDRRREQAIPADRAAPDFCLIRGSLDTIRCTAPNRLWIGESFVPKVPEDCTAERRKDGSSITRCR